MYNVCAYLKFKLIQLDFTKNLTHKITYLVFVKNLWEAPILRDIKYVNTHLSFVVNPLKPNRMAFLDL